MSNDNEAVTDPRLVEPLVERIKPILAGNPGQIQGAVLADLLAIFLAGHAPPLREQILAIHLETVRRLIPVNEAMIFPNGQPWD
jgi:hypothetical protein